MLAALEDKADLVDLVPDARVRQIVETWPTLFDTTLAEHLGFVGDAGLIDILNQAATQTRNPPHS